MIGTVCRVAEHSSVRHGLGWPMGYGSGWAMGWAGPQILGFQRAPGGPGLKAQINLQFFFTQLN